MTLSHGRRVHLCLVFGRSGPGAEAGGAHPGTEGELLALRRRKDLCTRHGHEAGDAPHGQVPWRAQLMGHRYAPRVEDGQSIQGQLKLLAATGLSKSEASPFTHQRVHTPFKPTLVDYASIASLVASPAIPATEESPGLLVIHLRNQVCHILHLLGQLLRINSPGTEG